MVKMVRVVEKSDKSIALINIKVKEGDNIGKRFDNLMDKNPELKDYISYFDTTPDLLPDLTKVDKWRMKADKKSLKIDNSVVTQKEKVKAIQNSIKSEFNKPVGSMDVEKVLRLQNQLTTKQY